MAPPTLFSFADRHRWSNETGLENLPKASFKLPSESWVWEPNASGNDGWALDATCGGEPTVGESYEVKWDPDDLELHGSAVIVTKGSRSFSITDREGWQYAVDFPAQYTPDMKFTSCVRRRRWVKFRSDFENTGQVGTWDLAYAVAGQRSAWLGWSLLLHLL